MNQRVNFSSFGGTGQPLQELCKFLLGGIDLRLGSTKVDGDRASSRDRREVDLDIRMRLSEVLDVTRFVEICEDLARAGTTNRHGGSMCRSRAL